MSLYERLNQVQSNIEQEAQRTKVLEDLTERVHQSLIKELGPELYNDRLDESELQRRIDEKLQHLVTLEKTQLDLRERNMLIESIKNEVIGYGPIDKYLKDDSVTEVMVNAYDQIYIEKDSKIIKTPERFISEAHLRRLIDKIVSLVGRRIDESVPLVDARLSDGSRVNAVIAPVAIGGAKLTIRKFARDPITIPKLVEYGTLTPKLSMFLEACVRGKLNILVSGGTGSGKTTTLNALSSFIPSDERIVTIEDAVELKLMQEHVLQLESRSKNIEGAGEITIRDLVRNSLRMRPDRIIVGEVRGGEALDMMQAMNTGHEGSLSTLHANSPRDAISRLETMILMAGMDLPLRAIREQVSSAVDLIVHQDRMIDGKRRVTQVTEVQGMEGDTVILQDIFMYDYGYVLGSDPEVNSGLRSTGIRPKFVRKLQDRNIELGMEIFEERYF